MTQAANEIMITERSAAITGANNEEKAMDRPTIDYDVIARVFFPYLSSKQKQVQESNGRFVHYTSSEAAMNMIASREVWMRKSSVMNDFMEIRHGLSCLASAYHSDVGGKFKYILNNLYHDVCTEFENIYNGWVPQLESDTYITCISGHLDDEDNIGRLSMWRAYGGSTGVALVINNTALLSASDALAAYSGPVAYLSERQFQDQFRQIVNNIEASTDLLKRWDRQQLLGGIFHMFRFMVLCSKHPGFYEEREWRIMYSPKVQLSQRVSCDVKVIRGVPQLVCKIPLKDIPDEGFVGAEIPSLVSRVIIGPTEHPLAMHEAFVVLLENAGVENAANKVCISDIPLRY
jgi:hypothetical protein